MVAQLSSPCSLSFQNCHLVRPACSIVAPESPCKRPMASPFSDVQGPLPPPGHAEEPQLPPVGHRVMMEDGRLGTVRWVGRIIPPVRRTKKERETRVVAHPLNEHVRGVCVPPSALCEDTRTCYLPAAVGAGRTRPASWWIGVEWDDHHAGKHDGCIDGTRYFRCSHPHVETYKTGQI
eukprot:GHVT01032118.1.p1 GENE.GHVT01032118.1~~GHVT01032118.1.p1  ORF type:complete len:178 (-),score=8.82 GHVT01032118.1:92-625(-)